MKNTLFAVMLLITPVSVQASGGWDFKHTPYAWFAGVKGEASTIPGAPIVPIGVSQRYNFDRAGEQAWFDVDGASDIARNYRLIINYEIPLF